MYVGENRNSHKHHDGIDPDLTSKPISHSYKYINEFIKKTSDKYKMIGVLGALVSK